MKSHLLVLATLALCSFSFGATPYVSGEFGVVAPVDATVKLTGYTDSETEYDSAMSFGLSAGFGFEQGTKLGVLFTSQENEGTIKQISSDLLFAGLSPVLDVKVNTLGLNLTQKMPTNNDFNFFLNGGLGLAFSEIKTSSFSVEDTVNYFNIGGGGSFSLSDSLNIYAKYNYFIMGDAEETSDLNIEGLGIITDVSAETEMGMHQFMVGISKTL